ncbi:MAG: VWA-like domain-containing protein [Bryobacteraceae bacterium]|nr:VWA-like domain-containing protein [Bryobacteraceae bacterium]
MAARVRAIEIQSAEAPTPEDLERARRAVERAVASLWTRNRGLSRWRTFYACLAAQLDLRVEWEPAVCLQLADGTRVVTGRRGWTDGRRLVLNAAMQGDDQETLKVVIHELEHIARLHLLRLGDRDLRLWNVATDLVINAEIAQEFGSPPAGGLHAPNLVRKAQEEGQGSGQAAAGNALVGLSAPEMDAEERVYERLVAQGGLAPDSGLWTVLAKSLARAGRGGKAGAGQEEGGTFRAEDIDVDLVPLADGGARGEELERIVRAAAVLSNSIQPGSVPAYAVGLLQLVLKDTPPWERVLRRWLSALKREKRSWRRLHRRSAFLPYMAPGRETERDMMGLVVDTSGSMRPRLLAEALGEIRAVVQALNVGVIVWQADVRVYGPVVYPSPADLPLEWELWGRGGTLMTEAAEAVRQRNPGLTVWVTDGIWFDVPQLPEGRHVALLVPGGRVPQGVAFDEVIEMGWDY